MTTTDGFPGPSHSPRLAVDDLAGGLGGGLLVVAVGDGRTEVHDITVAEPGLDVLGQAGDLLLGIGVDSDDAVGLIEAATARGVAAVVLRRSAARSAGAHQAAVRGGTVLVELSDQASWAHAVWLLRGVLDRAHAPRASSGAGPVHDELFALADGCAALLDAPVTIEDPQSRVLAYSSRQDATDASRVSTIVGRRVPEEVLSGLRSRGVFRKLARAREPFWVPPAPDGSLRARLVVPVRAGRERLGSIWAVVDERPPEDRLRALAQTASVVALHLLRMRADADVAGRAMADRVRELLTGQTTGDGVTSDGVPVATWLPPGPWRVAVLAGADAVPVRQLALWDSALRRASWRRPLLTAVDEVLLAIVTAGDRPGEEPGTWPWLAATATRLADDHEVRVAGGGVAQRASELARSRDEAYETARLLAAGRVPGCVVTFDEAWAEVTVARAVAGLSEPAALLGPVARLQATEGGRERLATVAAWLDHPGDPRAVASRLHVHPNTVRYRMARIGDELPVELSDPTVRLALRLQLAALGL